MNQKTPHLKPSLRKRQSEDLKNTSLPRKILEVSQESPKQNQTPETPNQVLPNQVQSDNEPSLSQAPSFSAATSFAPQNPPVITDEMVADYMRRLKLEKLQAKQEKYQKFLQEQWIRK